MSNGGVTDEVKSFIIENIDSVGQLEVLLLMAKNPDREWTASAVSSELRSSDASAGIQLRELASRGILARADKEYGAYVFKPANEGMRRAIEGLLAVHNTFQARIIGLIYNKPIERIRVFADAFKIRKDEDNG